MQLSIRAGIFVLAIAFTSTCAAYADAVLNLVPATLSATASGTVEFDGTIINTGTADLYLNGDVVILNFPDLTVDDSIFYIDAPLFLSAGDSYIGAFFDVSADATILPGSYSGTYTVLGGSDADTLDNIATANFTVDFGSETSVTPEPTPFLLLATGLAILTFVSIRKHNAAIRRS